MKREFSPATTLYCLIGNPVSHSKSPAMMNAAFQAMGIDAVYLAFLVPDKEVGSVLNALKTINVGGINVTAPHKERVIEFLDELSPTAELSNAVNTIVPAGDKFLGHNTDGVGLVSAIKAELSIAVSRARILIIGAGGAARGVIFSIAKEKPHTLTIANRTIDKAKFLKDKLKAEFQSANDVNGIKTIKAISLDQNLINSEIDQFDIIINTTALPISPAISPVKADETTTSPKIDFLGLNLTNMKAGALFYDLNYGKGNGDIARVFKENGIIYSDGLTMLLHQGTHAFSLWTGQTPPLEAMKDALGLG